MIVTIVDPALTKQLEATSLAAGQSVEDFVLAAVREKLARPQLVPSLAERHPIDWAKVKEIQQRIATAPTLDHRSADEVLDYDENGLFRS